MSVQSTQLNVGGFTQIGGYSGDISLLPRVKAPIDVSLPKTEPANIPNSGPMVLQQAVDQANQVFQQSRLDIKFAIDPESNEVMVKLIEPSSGDVINQYPNEQAVAIVNAIAQSQQQASEKRAEYQTTNTMLGMFVKQKS